MAFNQRFAGLRLQEQGGSKKFEEDFLAVHNAYRKQHGAQPLRLNRELCQSAQKWADHLLSLRSLKHSGTDHGENLFYKYSSSAKELPGNEPVDSWYSEIKNYNFSNPGFAGNTGHFTQVVWKDCREVGVGVATDGKGLFFVVGQYNPTGNITNPGYFEKNVLPAGAVADGNGAHQEEEGTEPKKDSANQKPFFIFGKESNKDSDEESNCESDFLSSHNVYRKRHGAAPLQLNRDLCRSAQQWADHLLSIRTLKHSSTEHGENLYYKYSSNARDLPGEEPVDSWYNEINNYDFAQPGFRSNTGHFTQVVWKDSKEVGVGVATDGNGLFFVVGQYNPAGNITNPGYFDKNVLPAGAAPPTDGAGSGSRWKPSSTKEPEVVDRPSTDRKPQPGFFKRDVGTFEQETLDTHNKYRRQHGAPPLQMNQELCESSRKWADYLLSINALQHSNTTHGENLWYKWNSSMKDASGSEVVDTWYGEIKDYNFSKPGFQSNTGHFTQVVWKESRELGIAKAVDGKGMVIAVAQYSPAGNITNPGYFQKNVLPKGTPVCEGGAAPDQGTTTTYYPASGGDDTTSTKVDSREFASEFLKANNAYRSRHGAKPLQLNVRISQEAQKWAEHLLTLKTLKHSETSYGENIWAKSGGPSITVTGQEVADSWYKEEKNYNFSKPGYQSDTVSCGHFTQMVWKASKEVGVGLASSGKGMFIVVAQYNPSGNITNPGFYARNILPRGSKVTDDDDEDGFVKDTSPTGVTAVPEKELKAFRKDLLSEHNKYRRLHGSGALQLSTSLTQEAQQWADHLVGIRALQNSDTQHGENLWYRWGTDTTLPTGKEVAESWYNEISKYSFITPGFQGGSGNFTQMVWKQSSQVGFGLSTDNKGMYIAVGFYDPAGNIANKGYFEDNVLQKKK